MLNRTTINYIRDFAKIFLTVYIILSNGLVMKVQSATNVSKISTQVKI